VARDARDTEATILNSVLPVEEEGTNATLLVGSNSSSFANFALRQCKPVDVFRFNGEADDLLPSANWTEFEAAATKRVAFVTAACRKIAFSRDFLRRTSDKRRCSEVAFSKYNIMKQTIDVIIVA
jgi:hypothetical protein